MAINFPDSPSAGDPHTEAGVTWTYDGEKWVSENTAAPTALWTRAGTVLSPATAGDDVDLGTGDLSAVRGNFQTPGGRVVELNVGKDSNGLQEGNLHLFSPTTDPAQSMFGVYSGTGQGKFYIYSDGTTKIGGDIVSNSPNITLNADGQLVLGNDFPSGKEGSHIYPTGQANLYRATAANQATWTWYSDIGGTRVPKIEFRTNGSAKFASVVAENQVITRSVTIDLEPDDPANYTTTMVDGEEQRVYSGPTLDVKEKLLDFVARIEALEAANASLEARLTALEAN